VAYAKRRAMAGGHIRFTAVYLDPDERERSAGTFDAKRVAERAARAAEEAELRTIPLGRQVPRRYSARHGSSSVCTAVVAVLRDGAAYSHEPSEAARNGAASAYPGSGSAGQIAKDRYDFLCL